MGVPGLSAICSKLLDLQTATMSTRESKHAVLECKALWTLFKRKFPIFKKFVNAAKAIEASDGDEELDCGYEAMPSS